MLPAQAFWNCEMEAPRQETSIESPDRAGLLRRCFLTLILESHCASPRNPPAGPERVRSRDAFGSRRAARLTVPRSHKQLLPCTGEPRLVCRASGLVSVIRSNATDRAGTTMARDEELGLLRVPFSGSSRVFGGLVLRHGGDARWSDLLAGGCMLPRRDDRLVIRRSHRRDFNARDRLVTKCYWIHNSMQL
jgi:hypothetical protein